MRPSAETEHRQRPAGFRFDRPAQEPDAPVWVSLRLDGWREGPAKLTVLRLARLGFCLAMPLQRQELLYSKPPHHRHPLRRTPGGGSPPSPRVPARRPGSLYITASCLQRGGFTDTRPAIPTLRARWGKPRASSPASFPPPPRTRGFAVRRGRRRGRWTLRADGIDKAPA